MKLSRNVIIFVNLSLSAGVEPVPAHCSGRIPRPSPLAFAFDLRKTEVARLLTDGLVYTCRDTVHITKYCAEPPHLQHLHNLVSSAALSLKESELRHGGGVSGHMSPRRVSSSSSLISSAGSKASPSAGPSTPRSSSTSFFSLSSSSHSSCHSSKNNPPQRSVSETHSNGVNGVKNGNSSVPTSNSSPSLSLTAKQAGLSKKKNRSSHRSANPSPNMVFPDHKDTAHMGASHNDAANHHNSNNNCNNNILNGNHCSDTSAQCNGAVGSQSGLTNGSRGCIQLSQSNGHHKHRSSSSSRSGSQQSLNISRRPSLSDTFSFSSSRNSSPGPSVSSQQEQEAVDTELHELALLVCHTAPSLQQLCRRTVHRAITTRKDRERCVEKLPVWKKMHRYILFQGPEYQL